MRCMAGVSGGRSVAKILVADDNSNIQKMVGLALKDQGIDVVAVGNGEAAVRKISDIIPDLVLADVFMPVRNGYEVCKYVKDDPKLSHIPVILLVGAFDPLDEQEAQRVGADGVLKKPFVPPDPLISMVKSALLRAGVPLGNQPAPVEKAPEVVAKKASDLLSPIAKARLEAINAQPLPEIEMSPIEPPIEDFGVTASAAPVHIDAGKEPVAFGSLLGTADSEDDAAFLPKNGAAAEHAWGTESEEKVEVEEEEDEEESHSAHAAWRPGGVNDADDNRAPAGTAPKDWREEAFHGASPGKHSKSHGWAPSIEEPAHALQAASVGVTTMEPKPVEGELPFSGDAWAAAMAAGVEDKVNETQELTHRLIPEMLPEIQHAPMFSSSSVSEPEAAQASVSTVEPETAEAVKAVEPVNNWFSVSSSPWDSEARKISQLASTWDAPAAQPGAPEKPAEHISSELTVQSEALQSHAVVAEPDAETRFVEESTTSYVNGASDELHGHYATESVLQEAAAAQEVSSLPALHHDSPEQVSELPAYTSEVNEHLHAPAAEAQEPVATSSIASSPVQPNMDELVARVLEKMSPDVLQRVTRDILRPVIEAIIKDELDNKKS
jgi:CheY-like chemotaxis protein